MRSYAWVYHDWQGGPWPSFGNDEWHRHTVVLPFPIPHRGHDGEKAYHVLVLVSAPWWACRWNRRGAAYIKYDRIMQDALNLVDVDSEEWGHIYDGLKAARPPMPKEWCE